MIKKLKNKIYIDYCPLTSINKEFLLIYLPLLRKTPARAYKPPTISSILIDNLFFIRLIIIRVNKITNRQ